eukprot:TRINITY_DN1067_c0_g2_i1.p1 TRINITY_DN1067_c0_g2~~TRINITY_DN1067_c0_g2_i1.p1  ORF type:complete len:210 (+),score=26.57 TRINITY_DN1067_c0_g2_i1:53-682(+)
MTADVDPWVVLSDPLPWILSSVPPVAHIMVIGLTRLTGHDVVVADSDKVRDVVLALVGMLFSNVIMMFLLPGAGWSFFGVVFGILVLDTVEYWVHRYMHMNKWLYRHTHQTHHMPKVCAILALYNSAFEAVPVGTLIALAFRLSGITWLDFIIVTSLGNMKTAWDHASTRKGHHHELHHMKPSGNFEQPFFDVWDRLMGTKVWSANAGI